jgi:hypothetical protein
MGWMHNFPGIGQMFGENSARPKFREGKHILKAFGF